MIFAGLGNPENYCLTRHNIGRDIVLAYAQFLKSYGFVGQKSDIGATKSDIDISSFKEALSKFWASYGTVQGFAGAGERKYNNFIYKKKFKSYIAELMGDIYLLPETYMNLSGEAIGAASKFFKIKPQNIVVVYDDIDINFSDIKLKVSKSSGGHNGLKSAIQHIGSDFIRVRVGIKGSNLLGGNRKIPTDKFVLSRFNDEEMQNIKDIYNKCFYIFECLKTQGLLKAQNMASAFKS